MFVATGGHISEAFWDRVQKTTRNRRPEKRKN